MYNKHSYLLLTHLQRAWVIEPAVDMHVAIKCPCDLPDTYVQSCPRDVIVRLRQPHNPPPPKKSTL